MNNSRRNFIKQSTFTMAAFSLAKTKSFASAFAADHITGVQLYSVRDDMGKDPSGTLKQLAAMGYEYVEHANYRNRKFYGYTAPEFKKLLDDLGLKMRSGHTVMTAAHWDDAKNDFTDVWKQTVEDAATLGQQYVISPWLDEALRTDMDKLKKMMDIFNKSGELCTKYNMKFGYHNHDFEIVTKVGDENLYDFIIKNTNPNLVIQQIDIGNMYGNGGRAIEIMKKYPGRFQSMHVKDEIKAAKGEMGGEPYESAVLGKGVLNVREILDYGKKHSGTKHFIIEQESYQGQAPLDAVKEDLVMMKKWGY
ncbi:sugar phosphate isomerase/epimerase family protein [Parafilimonas terrae]|uniref:Sugar phosphate isomerase/epimerase n=1 Tax=Parafilimonas terrae TaxID=1465490 RepID=A0A1I5YID1_9BACT|nr:TIM barrel protein [Parafilimonas terrae]SFQ43647.1 Sugar phosphate isomerase/epimerase [Parafilimonas terrae]